MASGGSSTRRLTSVRRWWVAAACAVLGTTIVPCRAAGQAQAPPSVAGGATAADVAFVRGMIAHHRQAIEMSALIAGRTTREALLLLGERITVSQRDEIAMMERWLHRHAPEAMATDPAASAQAHAHPADVMPGMLTAQAMAQLASAVGVDFDRRFLDGMIAHHRGALEMVQALLRSDANARQPQLRQMVIEIDADQRADIRRMEQLLAGLGPAPPRDGA